MWMTVLTFISSSFCHLPGQWTLPSVSRMLTEHWREDWPSSLLYVLVNGGHSASLSHIWWWALFLTSTFKELARPECPFYFVSGKPDVWWGSLTWSAIPGRICILSGLFFTPQPLGPHRWLISNPNKLKPVSGSHVKHRPECLTKVPPCWLPVSPLY